MSARKRNLSLLERAGAGIIYAIAAVTIYIAAMPIVDMTSITAVEWGATWFGVTFILFNLWKFGRI